MKYKLYRCIGITLSLLGSAIICFRTVLAEVLLTMDIGDWITIGGIVIGFVGVILGVTIPLRRDGKTIDETKAIAADIQPTINNIDYRTEKHTEKIDFIAKEIEFYQRLKSEAATNSVNPEELIAQFVAVIEEKAALDAQHKSDQAKIAELTKQNKRLQFRNRQLEAALNRQAPTPSDDEEWEP